MSSTNTTTPPDPLNEIPGHHPLHQFWSGTAFVLAIVGTGSFIEGLLDDVMKLRDPEIRKAETTTLDLLLKTAHRRGWIQPDAFEFSDIVRQYRNFVHPRAQQRRGITPDADTVLMCWQPVLAVVNDLNERLPGRQRASRVSQ